MLAFKEVNVTVIHLCVAINPIFFYKSHLVPLNTCTEITNILKCVCVPVRFHGISMNFWQPLIISFCSRRLQVFYKIHIHYILQYDTRVVFN